MLNEKDLEAAVKSGVITAEQAAALRRQAASEAALAPATAAERRSPETETPRVTRGFNDVMLALGTAIIAIALISQWGMWSGGASPYLYATFPVMWGISELLRVRERAVLPGIVAVLTLSLAAAYLGGRYGLGSFQAHDSSEIATAQVGELLRRYSTRVTLAATLAVAATNAIYYVRFRLPFALLPLALSIGIAAVQALILAFGWEQAARLPHLLGLFFGFALFALAMWYDTSDPQRRTRLADCGFWLHLAAAPLIVHSLLSIFGGSALAETGLGAWLSIVMIATLTLVALVIDRRALIVSSLSYLLGAVGYIVSTASELLGGSTFATLVVLGLVVLVIGMGWHPARRLVLAPFRGQAWLTKLPPVPA